MKETGLTIVNQMNIALKERIIKIQGSPIRPAIFTIPSKRSVTRMLIVPKWKVMHIALVMLVFSVMAKNIVFQTVVSVIGQTSSPESAMMLMNA